MGVLALSSPASASAAAATAASFAGNFPLFPSRVRVRRNRDKLLAKQKKFLVSASKREEPKLSEWDQMELKFGRLLGEDPKLTLAKIVARKVNPEATFNEVEKSFYKNKGKIAEIEEVPLDWSKENKKKKSTSLDGLNLVKKPVPKDGVKFETSEKPMMKKPNPVLKKPSEGAAPIAPPIGRLPNVILRKPSSYYVNNGNDDDGESKLRFKPNLTLKMRNGREDERFSDMTLLRKPEPVKVDEEEESSEDKLLYDGLTMEEGEKEDGVYSEYTLLQKPEARPEPENVEQQDGDSGDVESSEIENNSIPTEMQLNGELSSGSSEEKTINSDPVERIPSNPVSQTTVEASLQGKPQRLDPSSAESSVSNRGQPLIVNHEGRQVSVELKGPPTRSSVEESDWNRAEFLVKTESRADVEIISSSTRGFAVSFGYLIGFVPYRNVAARWKFLAFESWLRRKGVDPSLYRQNLEVIPGQDVTSKAPSSDSSLVDSEVVKTVNGEVSSDMTLEDLLMVYDREKKKYLSSYVGQKLKVNVVMANRNTRKLVFSMRPRENEEDVEKKRNLMAKLRVGDVVKCCIKKITYYGIFCEVEGVTALIHQSEVSWDVTLDPTSCFKIGQIVEAKVHQLDFSLERIFLSLKEITPDPLTEALESVVGDNDQLGGRLQAAELDAEWPDVESLIKELETVEGIQSVSKGRFFLSPGLAPTFQVYMAPMFENQYKLLARAGNRVQELTVEASLSKEEMKTTIMSCANRVE